MARFGLISYSNVAPKLNHFIIPLSQSQTYFITFLYQVLPQYVKWIHLSHHKYVAPFLKPHVHRVVEYSQNKNLDLSQGKMVWRMVKLEIVMKMEVANCVWPPPSSLSRWWARAFQDEWTSHMKSLFVEKFFPVWIGQIFFLDNDERIWLNFWGEW